MCPSTTVTSAVTRTWLCTSRLPSVLRSVTLLWLVCMMRCFVLTCAGQCRPLSKTVRFNTLKVIKNKSTERAKMFHRY